MPNLDHTGPHGEGSGTGKKMGICGNGKQSGLGQRLRQHNKGCHKGKGHHTNVIELHAEQIVGIKKCRKHRH